MRSVAVVGEYQILGRCNDLDGVQVFAARKVSDRSAEHLYALHFFPIVSASTEHELRGLLERSRGLEDPILVAPRDVVRTTDGLYVVTDLVTGENLETIAKNDRASLPKLLIIAIVRDLVRAVERGRNRTGRAVIGDVSSSQVVISYETGELKLITIGLPLIRGRAVMASSKALGLILWEQLTGRKPDGDPQPPKAGADLDRIVMKAMARSPDDDLIGLADELQSFLSARSTGIDRAAELRKFIQQYFAHKATAMRALITRWRSLAGAAPPPARTPSLSRPPVPAPARTQSLRPISAGQGRPVTALAEPMEIVILPPEEAIRTEDISTSLLRRPRRTPPLRLAILLLLLSAALGALVWALMNGQADTIVGGWRIALMDGTRLVRSLVE